MNNPYSTHAADPNPLILYRGGRSVDGFCAALVAWLHFQGRGTYLAVDPGSLLPEAKGQSAYLLGLGISPSSLVGFSLKSIRTVVLDNDPAGMQDSDLRLSNVNGLVHLDPKQSVSRLTWTHFKADVPLPEVIRLIEDRELLKCALPESSAFLAHLDTEPLDFERWTSILNLQGGPLHDYVCEGRLMHAKLVHLAELISQDATPIVLSGEPGLMVQAPLPLHTFVGEILSEKCKTYALLWQIKNSCIQISLRSQASYFALPLARSPSGLPQDCIGSLCLPLGSLTDLLSGSMDIERLKSSRKTVRPVAVDEGDNAGRALFHGLWSAAAFSSRYDKVSWKNVHRQLIEAKLL